MTSIIAGVMWPEADRTLTSGPHGMSRAEVLEVQRARLLRATAVAVSRKGYAATTVGDLLGESGVSRRTFYELFADKEDCFLAAFGEVAAEIERRAGAAFDDGESAAARIRGAIEAVAGFCVEERHPACACIVESLAAGHAGRDARNALIGRLADLVEPALAELRPAGPGAGLVSRATVGGVFELLYGPLARHDAARLEDLAGQIGELPLVPVAAPQKS